MKMYTVTAEVNSDKYGKGILVAELNEQDFIKYANLSDQDKLAFLKDKGAQFQVDVNELEDDDVVSYKVEESAGANHPTQAKSSKPQVSRKMRMNINGQDTGWVDVTDENQAQYDQLMDHFNQMHQRFNDEFSRFFTDFRPGHFLDFDRPFLEDKKESDNDDSDKKNDNENKEESKQDK
ncbi:MULTISPECIES: hypothetical protein [Aerococcus]|uniref:hypothetical protein n=1 Tax=Aerococcus urinae (strain CCUG 59500 / ACS-120-V-Col10a) TaxID=2976812 RepID=UPI000200E564|nr:hypothetical protein [Aerococcus sp. Group 1]AEA01574.1 hypothetical protein HMPREF9243_1530 [Aerococcus sp. Group 1]MCY3030216.1 hypothetical protein [Aerococcus sp. Group 1]MCY3054591.1 hypothetical protein [Aerococcus sp. Group 1]MCY3056321.1 hypothetical protein [Aerococcus sp. Group 1]MCY3062485.1 hypothetical protein [Aerococcus sp. Group 1]